MPQSRNKSSTSGRRSTPPPRKPTGRHGRYWSARVTKRSDALDLKPDVFKSTDPRKIALSLKRSAQASKRRKGTPYQSAISMLNFYINRAGKSLPKKQKRVLERAKDELRDVFGRA
jgi:putative cell wall-binding protein